jgi:hypothetical protein
MLCLVVFKIEDLLFLISLLKMTALFTISRNFADILLAASGSRRPYKPRVGVIAIDFKKPVFFKPIQKPQRNIDGNIDAIILDISGAISNLGYKEDADKKTKEEVLLHCAFAITLYRNSVRDRMYFCFAQQYVSNFIGLKNCFVKVKLPEGNTVEIELRTVEEMFQLGKIAGAVEYMTEIDTEQKLL